LKKSHDEALFLLRNELESEKESALSHLRADISSLEKEYEAIRVRVRVSSLENEYEAHDSQFNS